jgi:threonylcarbamoyladenosine tRNA methylthiotransferase MtaB
LLEKELAARYHKLLIGRRLDVLVEGADPRQPGHVLGTSCRFAPVSLPGQSAALLGRRVPVRALAASAELVFAHPEPTAEPSTEDAGSQRVALPLVRFV